MVRCIAVDMMYRTLPVVLFFATANFEMSVCQTISFVVFCCAVGCDARYIEYSPFGIQSPQEHAANAASTKPHKQRKATTKASDGSIGTQSANPGKENQPPPRQQLTIPAMMQDEALLLDTVLSTMVLPEECMPGSSSSVENEGNTAGDASLASSQQPQPQPKPNCSADRDQPTLNEFFRKFTRPSKTSGPIKSTDASINATSESKQTAAGISSTSETASVRHLAACVSHSSNTDPAEQGKDTAENPGQLDRLLDYRALTADTHIIAPDSNAPQSSHQQPVIHNQLQSASTASSASDGRGLKSEEPIRVGRGSELTFGNRL